MKQVSLLIFIALLIFIVGFTQWFNQPVQEESDIGDLYQAGIITQDVYNNLIYFFENKLDPNFATAQDLSALPAVGPLDARNIVNYRDRVGGYTKADDLLNVPGIDRLKLEQFENFLTFEFARKRKIPIRAEMRVKISDSQKKPSSYTRSDITEIAIDKEPVVKVSTRLFFTNRYEIGLATVGNYIYKNVYFTNNRPEVFDKRYQMYLSNRYLLIKNARSRLFYSIILGDYIAKYGQIKVGRALGVGTLSRVRNISKTRLRGNMSSTGERGFAILSRWNVNLSSVLFYSDKDDYARYNDKDNPLLNRTRFVLDSSEKLPDLINVKKVGLNLNYSFINSYLDFNLWNYTFKKYYDFVLGDFPSSPNVWSLSIFGGKSFSNAVVYASYVRDMHSKTDALGFKSQMSMGSLRWVFTTKYKDADKDIDKSVGSFSINSSFRQRFKYRKTRWYLNYGYRRTKQTDINFLSHDSLLDYLSKELQLDTATSVIVSRGSILRTKDNYSLRLQGRITRYLTILMSRNWSDADVQSQKGNNITTDMAARLRPFSSAYFYLDGRYTENEVNYPSKYKQKLGLTLTFRYNVTRPLQVYFRYKFNDNNLSIVFDETLQYTFQMTYAYSRRFRWRIRYSLSDYYDARAESYYFEMLRKW